MKVFDYVKAVNSGKEVDDLSNFNSFLVIHHFSYFPDTIFAANELNKRAFLDSDMQFEFLINTIRPRKRFAKWSKADKNDDLKLISEYFGFGNEKALQALEILSDEQIDEIRKKFNKGGLKK